MNASSQRKREAFTLIELLIVIAIIAILALIAIPNFIQAQTRAKVSRVKADMRSLATAIEAYLVDHNNYPIFNQTDVNFTRCDVAYYSGTYNEVLALHSRSFKPGYMSALTTPVAYFGTKMPDDPFGKGTLKSRRFNDTGAWAVSYHFLNFYGATMAHREIGTTEWGVCNGKRTKDLRNLDAPNEARFNIGDGDNRPPQSDFEKAPTYYVNWILYSPGPDLSMLTPSGEKSFPHCLSTNTGWADLWYGIWHFYDPTNGVTSHGEIMRFDGPGSPE